MAQGDESQVAELLFQLVRNDDISGTLGSDPLLVGAEGMDRQARHQAPAVNATLHSADVGQPTGLGEGADQNAAHGVRRAPPQVFALVRSFHFFLKTEPVHPGTVVLVRQSHQYARQR
jgi:hypothetical protein